MKWFYGTLTKKSFSARTYNIAYDTYKQQVLALDSYRAFCQRKLNLVLTCCHCRNVCLFSITERTRNKLYRTVEAHYLYNHLLGSCICEAFTAVNGDVQFKGFVEWLAGT